MRHLKRGRKFGRERDQRKALMKSLASSFFVSGRMKTTEAKAKELRPYVEKLITKARNPILANRKQLSRVLPEGAVRLLLNAAKEYAGRPGGYTRIIKLGARKSDSAKMAIIELVK